MSLTNSIDAAAPNGESSVNLTFFILSPSFHAVGISLPTAA
nr:MAG TPA: hypothetical protein [Inoviridae sp.]